MRAVTIAAPRMIATFGVQVGLVSSFTFSFSTFVFPLALQFWASQLPSSSFLLYSFLSSFPFFARPSAAVTRPTSSAPLLVKYSRSPSLVSLILTRHSIYVSQSFLRALAGQGGKLSQGVHCSRRPKSPEGRYKPGPFVLRTPDVGSLSCLYCSSESALHAYTSPACTCVSRVL